MASLLMEQYARIKRNHPGEILLFRLGDFYEMFHEDAQAASRVLGIVLTSRAKGEGKIPMCGVPAHSAQSYIDRLLKAGHRVAVCEQMQDPADADGVVDRAVVRVITPGTLVEESILDAKRANHLAAVAFDGDRCGLAWADTSTGRFLAREIESSRLLDEVARLAPAETLLPTTAAESLPERLRAASGGIVTPWHDWVFDISSGREALQEHFGVATLRGFGCDELTIGLAAAGALLAYLKETQRGPLLHVRRIELYRESGRMILDAATQSALELRQTSRGDRAASLLASLDRTSTAMGARLLGDWVMSPLAEVVPIRERQDAVQELVSDRRRRDDLSKDLGAACDLERVLARVGTGRAHPRDLAALRDTLGLIPNLRKSAAELRSPLAKRVAGGLGDHSDLRDLLASALVDEPPHLLTEGGLIREGYHEELDRVRGIAKDGKGFLAAFQRDEIARTGIGSLKVGFNRVFGYYIEITNVHREKIPAGYIRKQTLKNAERYITPELKDHETQVLHADAESKDLERRLFIELRDRTAAHMDALQGTARALAELDALLSLASAAEAHGWTRPELTDEAALDIRDGRHPVLEALLADRFVPNDTVVPEEARILLITGPNMAGKSTYLRQTALIVLMAHMGSFVPATSARIGRADRIFARVGASDDLARNASTFMVEMSETANILNHATDRSLLILDEIGRGTSTFDGVSIAWAVVEHLHNRTKARTLFATHYHELTDLARALKGVRNLHVAVREWGDSVLFLHKILEGPTDRSYGIHVARLAGLPREVIERSKVILQGLEALTLAEGDRPRLETRKPRKGELSQLALFSKSAPPPKPSPIEEALRAIDVNGLTPVQAMARLAELVEQARKLKAGR
ncbi:MAG TPA: DNA mismatch repair protein MutS [Planctomycetota bacterium]|nr:DNA mismatch repair protein MutS [Planctomycetota bacterium]